MHPNLVLEMARLHVNDLHREADRQRLLKRAKPVRGRHLRLPVSRRPTPVAPAPTPEAC